MQHCSYAAVSKGVRRPFMPKAWLPDCHCAYPKMLLQLLPQQLLQRSLTAAAAAVTARAVLLLLLPPLYVLAVYSYYAD